jgi:hypothetical protein
MSFTSGKIKQIAVCRFKVTTEYRTLRLTLQPVAHTRYDAWLFLSYHADCRSKCQVLNECCVDSELSS